MSLAGGSSSGRLRFVVGALVLGVLAVRALASAPLGLRAAASADASARLRRPLAARRAKPNGVPVAACREFGGD